MKANELRIGNYVYDSFGIVEISINGVNYFGKSSNNLGKIEFASIYKPIPLTEDILLKCGFTFYKEENVWHTPHEFHIRVEDSELKQKNKVFWIYFDEQQDHPITCIFELHQLQNLYFALTGEELTIKL